jgi:hypothetical protein
MRTPPAGGIDIRHGTVKVGATSRLVLIDMFALFLLAATVAGPARPAVTLDQLEAEKDWSEDDRDRAIAAARLRNDMWSGCLRRAQTRLQRSKEPVETVATAVMGSCLDQEDEYLRALKLAYRGLISPTESTARAERMVARGRATKREALVARLVALRLPKGR